MTDKPMRWAVKAVDNLSLAGSLPHNRALAIKIAAEPLLAVVQAAQEVIDQDVKVSRLDGGENRLGISLANLERALPSALKAMEAADDEARPS